MRPQRLIAVPSLLNENITLQISLSHDFKQGHDSDSGLKNNE